MRKKLEAMKDGMRRDIKRKSRKIGTLTIR